MVDEGGVGRVLLAHQGVHEEEAPRRLGIDGPVVDAPVLDDGQPVEGRLLPGHHLGRALGPARISVAPPHQRPAGGLEPGRIDAGGVAGEELRGLHQLGGDDPRRRLLGQAEEGWSWKRVWRAPM